MQFCSKLVLHVWSTFVYCQLFCSFHVGSGCQSSSAYVKALEKSSELFHYGNDIGYNFTLLDIGGGFPGTKNSTTLFAEVSSSINEHLEKLFKYPNLTVIAEPGKKSGMCDCW